MNTENKIAIDIVLLLPDEMNKLARDLSSKIISPENMRQYKLGENDYLPHISLLMGTIFVNNIESIKNEIEPIVKKYLPIKITFTDIKQGTFSYLAIEKTEALVALQNEIAENIQLDYDANKAMFLDPDISDQGVDWINKFKENNLGEGKFNLHVTLGLGDASSLNPNLPIETMVNTIAICHIGYGCSCRKVFEKIIL
ncbi:MAG: hypothetical protein WC839_03495 [Candidatus Paceibacterota bacterium]